MAITVAMRTQVSQLYVSLFGRAPDGEGLGFWVAALAGGMTMAQIAESMYNTAPARTYYPAFATNQEIVATFYLNVLGRPADAEGLAFWTAELTNAPSKGAFFTKLLGNVVNYTGSNADGLKSQALFLNKVAVAQFYGETNGKIEGASAVLNGVTELPASVEAAKAAITVGTGQTFILTADQDNIIGTGANDTIRGIYEGEDATVTVGDSVDGGAGNDVLELTAQGGFSTEPGFVVKNVETINIRDLVGASFDAYSVENTPAINFTQTVTGNTANVVNAALGSKIGLSGKGNLTVGYAVTSGAADAANLALATAGTSAKVRSTVDVENADTIETVNVATSGTNFVTLAAGTAAAKLNITGNGTNDIVVSTMKTTVTIDASTSTGTNTIDIGTQLSNGDVFKGGTGADTVKFNTTAAIGAVVFTGVETLSADFDVNTTLNLDGSTGVKTLTIAGSLGDATVTNASADLTTVNITSVKDSGNEFNLSYKDGVFGNTTLNIGSTAATAADISMGDFEFTNVSGLSINTVGNKINTIGSVYLIDSENVTLSIGVNAESDLSGNATVSASSFESVDINVGASGYLDLYWILADDFGDIGDVNVVVGENAIFDVDYIGSGGGSIGDVNMAFASGASGTSTTITTYNAEYSATEKQTDIGDISITLASGAELGDVSGNAYSGDIGNLDLTAGADASAYVYLYAEGYSGIDETDDYVGGGNIGNITVNAIGADAYASAYASAYVGYASGNTGEGGNVGNLALNVSGTDASAYIDVSGGSGGNVGNIVVNADGASAYAYVSAYSYEALSAGGDIGTVKTTAGDDTNVYVVLDASGYIGDFDIEAGDNSYTYVSAAAYSGNLGDVVAAIGDDSDFSAYFSAGDTISTVDVTTGNDSSVYMYIGTDDNDDSTVHVNAVTVNAGAGSYVYVEFDNVFTADGVTVNGGESTDSAGFFVSGSAGSIDSINMSSWNGHSDIDLRNLETGTTIYVGKAGSDVNGSQETDVIYLNAGVDTVEIIDFTDGNDVIHGFKVGTGGDVIDFSGITFNPVSGYIAIDDVTFSDLDSAVADLEDLNESGTYYFIAQKGSDTVVYHAVLTDDADVGDPTDVDYTAVATLVGITATDLTAANFNFAA